jgi:hypothetical protein
MKIPFERLVEEVGNLTDADKDLPMGELAARFNTTAERLADAVTTYRMLRGERTYI